MILDFIRRNSPEDDPKITKSDVMKHLKDSRMMTTHKTTVELIKEGKIKMVKPKGEPYSRTDYLVINEKNEFNKIYNYLSEIESISNDIIGFISQYQHEQTFEDYDDFVKYLANLLNRYLLSSSVKTNNINSDNDKQILYKKIFEVMLKVAQFNYDQRFLMRQLNLEIEGLSDVINLYTNKKFLAWRKIMGKPEPPRVNPIIQSDKRLLKPMSDIMVKVNKILKE